MQLKSDKNEKIISQIDMQMVMKGTENAILIVKSVK